MSVLVIGLQSDRQRAAGKCCSRAGSAASRVSLQTLCMALNLGCRLCPLCGEQAQQSASPAVSSQQTADSSSQKQQQSGRSHSATRPRSNHCLAWCCLYNLLCAALCSWFLLLIYILLCVCVCNACYAAS